MSRTDKVYLNDILESIELILGYIEGKQEYDFLKDIMLQDAVIRRYEIIGEASSKISETIKQANPHIQWRLMKAMRNKLTHEYFGVSAHTIFASIHFDLPVLKEQLIKLNETFLD